MQRQLMSSPKDRPARTTLAFLIPIFIAVLALGWYRLLLEPLGNNELIAWAAAVFISFAAVATARSVAQELIQKRARRSDTPNDTVRGTQAAHIVLLFVFSTVGTMSTLTYYGEGPTIVQESIDDLRESLTDLHNGVKGKLPTPNFDRFENQVTTHWAKLETEIKNPRNCGDGPEAIRHINALGKLLPGFSRPSGVIRNCHETEALVEQYRARKDDLLLQSLVYKSDMVAEKEQFLTELPAFIERTRRSLDEIQAILGNQRYSLAEVKTRIEVVAESIKEQVKRASTLAGAPIRLEHPVELDQLRGVGSYWQTLPLLLERWNHISTYIILIGACLFDVIMVVSFARVMHGQGGGLRAVRETREMEDEDGPVRLWHQPRTR